MDQGASIAELAGLLADRSRAVMVASLMGGSSRPGSELALLANLSAPSASMHLAKLVEGGVLVASRQGRNRYYRIASAAMAHAVEALGAASTVSFAVNRRAVAENPWAFARTCYDHLAGRLGVALAAALESRGLLACESRQLVLRPPGAVWLRDFGLDPQPLLAAKRSFAPQCLDWTERRYHVAGALGAALLHRMLALGWVKTTPVPRLLRLTAKGQAGLYSSLAIVVKRP